MLSFFPNRVSSSRESILDWHQSFSDQEYRIVLFKDFSAVSLLNWNLWLYSNCNGNWVSEEETCERRCSVDLGVYTAKVP